MVSTAYRLRFLIRQAGVASQPCTPADWFGLKHCACLRFFLTCMHATPLTTWAVRCVLLQNDFALIAAMELHARLINAANNVNLLPAGFDLVKNMPKAPNGTTWTFQIGRQTWVATNTTSKIEVQELGGTTQFIVANTAILPTGWELAYNHFWGRLGIEMPETRQFLLKWAPDCYLFRWGLYTLTHANSAATLWRPGVVESALCQAEVPVDAPVAEPPVVVGVIDAPAYGTQKDYYYPAAAPYYTKRASYPVKTYAKKGW